MTTGFLHPTGRCSSLNCDAAEGAATVSSSGTIATLDPVHADERRDGVPCFVGRPLREDHGCRDFARKLIPFVTDRLRLAAARLGCEPHAPGDTLTGR